MFTLYIFINFKVTSVYHNLIKKCFFSGYDYCYKGIELLLDIFKIIKYF